MKFINAGYSNLIASERIVLVAAPDSAPVKRLMQDAKDMGRAIDCTSGRKTRSVVVTDSDHVILSAIQTETLASRLAGETDSGDGEDSDDEK